MTASLDFPENTYVHVQICDTFNWLLSRCILMPEVVLSDLVDICCCPCHL